MAVRGQLGDHDWGILCKILKHAILHDSPPSHLDMATFRWDMRAMRLGTQLRGRARQCMQIQPLEMLTLEDIRRMRFLTACAIGLPIESSCRFARYIRCYGRCMRQKESDDKHARRIFESFNLARIRRALYMACGLSNTRAGLLRSRTSSLRRGLTCQTSLSQINPSATRPSQTRPISTSPISTSPFLDDSVLDESVLDDSVLDDSILDESSSDETTPDGEYRSDNRNTPYIWRIYFRIILASFSNIEEFIWNGSYMREIAYLFYMDMSSTSDTDCFLSRGGNRASTPIRASICGIWRSTLYSQVNHRIDILQKKTQIIYRAAFQVESNRCVRRAPLWMRIA